MLWDPIRPRPIGAFRAEALLLNRIAGAAQASLGHAMIGNARFGLRWLLRV